MSDQVTEASRLRWPERETKYERPRPIGPGSFFDADGGDTPRFALTQESSGVFLLGARFGYDAPGIGRLTVPNDLQRFRTDLASIPQPFRWLIPPLGEHLPAILLHDALIVGDDEPYTYDLTPDIDGEIAGDQIEMVRRLEADLILRHAMKTTGTPFLRRWMIWAGVTVATVASWSTAHKLAVGAFFLLLAVLGSIHTLDLLDLEPLGFQLPWLADRGWTWELPVAVVLAVVVPLLASIPWGKHRRGAFAVVGSALAWFLLPTVIVGFSLAVYAIVERPGKPDHTHSRQRLAWQAASRIVENPTRFPRARQTTRRGPLGTVTKPFRKLWLFLRYRFRPKTRPRRYPRGQTGVYPVPNRTEIGIAGDWGSGTSQAAAVARELGAVHYAVHLGDIYHVGAEEEIRRNFLNTAEGGANWKKAGSAGRLALPGNHEYQSGGKAFYKTLLPEMGIDGTTQETSFFCLENEHWLVIGLDTGFKSVRWVLLDGSIYLLNFVAQRLGRPALFAGLKTSLPRRTRKWLTDQVHLANRQNLGLIVLSHHQYFTALDRRWDYPKPGQQLARILKPRDPRTVLWFWGHEHRLVIYDEPDDDHRTRKNKGAENLVVLGRAVGNGGAEPDPVENVYGCTREIHRTGLRYVDNRAGNNGYATIAMNGPELEVTYYTLAPRHHDGPSPSDTYEPELLLSETFTVRDGNVVVNGEPIQPRERTGFITPSWIATNLWPPRPASTPDSLVRSPVG